MHHRHYRYQHHNLPIARLVLQRELTRVTKVASSALAEACAHLEVVTVRAVNGGCTT